MNHTSFFKIGVNYLYIITKVSSKTVELTLIKEALVEIRR